MGSIIDNREKTMLQALKNALQQTERVDILTAFFYFSGFDALADELKDKKIRILVGKTIDPELVSELSQNLNNGINDDLSAYSVRGFYGKNNLQKKKYYFDSFISLFNKSVLSEQFDSNRSQEIFKMFMGKLDDGSLEIKITSESNHGKFYLLTNKPEFSCNGDQKGIVIMGSSNFTFNGLIGQGEMNDRSSENSKYDEYKNVFENLWNDSKCVDISVENGNKDFINNVKERTWLYAVPTPYQIYTRILFELYKEIDDETVKEPYEITSGKFNNFKYQLDAIKLGIDCIKKNNGVIISDVVGLGKSIIASAIAYNLDMSKTVIITPPHLVGQWEQYQQEFGLRGVKVASGGKIETIYNTYKQDDVPILYIIDEAHRYRNELTDNYQYLHQLTRSNKDNKVILLTATPYNNRPQDLFALIKLFQTPSRSTINTVENLGMEFREAIAKYNVLQKEGKKNLTNDIKKELDKLSEKLRRLISPVIIRRSRIDLQEVEEYKKDLELQNIRFPEVVGPELKEYDLGEIRELYVNTLNDISKKYKSSRYNPAHYLKDVTSFNNKYGELFGDMNVELFFGNLAENQKRLLVMRFESSKQAFKTTIEKIITSYQNAIKWWDKGYVPIKRKGNLCEPDDNYIEDMIEQMDEYFDNPDMDLDKLKKEVLPFETNLFKNEYIADIKSDLELLNNIKSKWFQKNEIGFDPKFKEVLETVKKLLNDNHERKIVIFTVYSDTANYINEKFKDNGIRSILYSGASSDADRKIVIKNFDASIKNEEKSNDYDIIVCTDALSEGINLNRAGVVINYDIPYNPTRVVQRIGRINRINKKMFDKIFIYNFFPTDIGEGVTLTKGISTLKMLLINNIVGSDTKTLTTNEELQSYFKDRFDEANEEENSMSWDNIYRNDFNLIKSNEEIKKEAYNIPERSRIVRIIDGKTCAVSFAKRGSNVLFAVYDSTDNDTKISSMEDGLKLFYAQKEEKGYESDGRIEEKFDKLKQEIKKPSLKVKLDKRKNEAIGILDCIKNLTQYDNGYIEDLLEIIKTYDDLSDGELKYISGIRVQESNVEKCIKELKERIPEHYIIQIKEKVENIDKQNEVIMFTEDIRNGE